MNKKIIVILLAVFLTLVIFGASFSEGMTIATIEERSADLQSSVNSVNRYAVLIGTEYKNVPCDKDVEIIFNVLTDRGWNSDNINKQYVKEAATKENILEKAIPWLEDREHEDDIVLFYFSGHGYFGGIYDYKEKNKITVSELDAAFDNFDSNNVVLIFDSCYSGSLSYKNNRGSELTINDLNNKHCKMLVNGLSREGRVILAACEADEGALFLEYSHFTFQLAYALWADRWDTNDNGWISAEEAFVRARDCTIAVTDDCQHPQMSDGCPGEVDLVSTDSSSKNHRGYSNSFCRLITMRLIEIHNILFSKIKLFRNI
jgi:hypothetical protein